MKLEPNQENFKPIVFQHKEVPGIDVCKYRIYKDHSNYVVVEANNAQKALEASPVPNPVRVLRDNLFLENVVKLAASETPREDLLAATIVQSEQFAAVEKTAMFAKAAEETPLENAVPEQATVEQATVEQAAVEGNSEASSAPAEEGVLSSDEVEKLLNS